MVERGGPQMAIWRMRVACCIPKATNTHSDYVKNYCFFFHCNRVYRKALQCDVIRKLLVLVKFSPSLLLLLKNNFKHFGTPLLLFCVKNGKHFQASAYFLFVNLISKAPSIDLANVRPVQSLGRFTASRHGVGLCRLGLVVIDWGLFI